MLIQLSPCSTFHSLTPSFHACYELVLGIGTLQGPQ